MQRNAVSRSSFIDSTHLSLRRPRFIGGFAPREQNHTVELPDTLPHEARALIPRLVKVARTILGSDDLAWDITQETLFLFWQRQPAPHDVTGWLMRTVVNIGLGQRRRLVRSRVHERRAAEQRPEYDRLDDPASALEDAELHERVSHALATLREEYRTAFVLREMDGLDYGEIARRLDVPVGTVRSRLSRARVTLRERLSHLLREDALCVPCVRWAREAPAQGIAEQARVRPPARRQREPRRMTHSLLKRSCAGILVLVCATHAVAQSTPRGAIAPTAPPVATAVVVPSAPALADQPEIETRTLIRSMHTRLQFDREICRVAVGDTDVLAEEPINNREVLVLGKEIGRTSLIVWFLHGTLREFVFVVQRDISLLEAALHDIHPGIQVEIAPDRDAIVLRGIVPDLATSRLAESAAQSYLDARGRRQEANAQGMLSTTPTDAQTPAANGQQPPGAQATAGAASSERLRAPQIVAGSGKVINLLRLEHLPTRPEQHLQEAFAGIGGADVRVRRVQHGALPDDAKDILVLEGSVADQVALVRVLGLAARIFVGETGEQLDIRVLADEAGALESTRGGQGSQQGFQQSGSSGLSGISFGLRSTRELGNRIQNNVARAKALEIANGRILSFIAVRDLPQVRIDIRLLEINRTRLESFNSQLVALASDFDQPSLNPAAAAIAVQGPLAARPGAASNTDIQDALGFLSGSFTHQLQISGQHFALDSLLSVLESRGIARTLSQPSLAVLSGEEAIFQVGGEIPIQTTQTFGTSTVVQVSTTFQEFGIQLFVRPLVGEDGDITMDVVPQVVNPDPELTKSISQSTATPPSTVAFDSRSLRTSARLKDGQVMLIGGLISRKTTDQQTGTPVLSKIPLLGDLFKGFSNEDDEQELVVIVNPVIVRQEPRDLSKWIFPDMTGLIWAPLTAQAARAAEEQRAAQQRKAAEQQKSAEQQKAAEGSAP
jgi:RNA polymerase sigma factor (sigma-70 family)